MNFTRRLNNETTERKLSAKINMKILVELTKQNNKYINNKFINQIFVKDKNNKRKRIIKKALTRKQRWDKYYDAFSKNSEIANYAKELNIKKTIVRQPKINKQIGRASCRERVYVLV